MFFLIIIVVCIWACIRFRKQEVLLCDFSLQSSVFTELRVTCINQVCTYEYPSNPSLPLVVHAAVVGTRVSFPLLNTNSVNCMGIIVNCNAFPVTATDANAAWPIPGNSIFLANYGNFATAFDIT